ncbi:MAG: PD40 domain-containing protein [Bacteroidales bacterium]|nr:PD40 domain-containing protein [Bacteroidales bacterium]
MKRFLIGTILLLLAGSGLRAQHILDLPEALTMPVPPERMTVEQIVARADSLHRAYRFQEALELYMDTDQMQKAAFSQNGLNLMDLCAKPHVVARQRFSRKDFFLYYPLPQHAWHPSPNQLDSSDSYPLYYPKGADVIYFSARDRAGTRSLFVTEDMDSTWRSPRHLGEAHLSIGNEVFPMLSPDGQTLYFASDGLAGVGGFDLYSSRWDAENGRWSAPMNMGFPFNSPADDLLFCETQDGKYTLFASNRDCSRDSVYVYVLDRSSIDSREPVRDVSELAELATLKAVKDPSRMDAASAMSSAPQGNANTRLYARKMEEARALRDAISKEDGQAARDSLLALLEEVNLEIRLVEQSFLQSGVVGQTEDREVVGASLSYTFAKNAMGSRFKLRMGAPLETSTFRVMPVGRFAPDNKLPDGIVYQIVLFSSAGHAGLDDLRGVSPVYERLGSNLRYTYATGLYRHYVSALLDLNSVRVLGFPAAHIVAYRDGRPIPVSVAQNEEE